MPIIISPDSIISALKKCPNHDLSLTRLAYFKRVNYLKEKTLPIFKMPQQKFGFVSRGSFKTAKWSGFLAKTSPNHVSTEMYHYSSLLLNFTFVYNLSGKRWIQDTYKPDPQKPTPVRDNCYHAPLSLSVAYQLSTSFMVFIHKAYYITFKERCLVISILCSLHPFEVLPSLKLVQGCSLWCKHCRAVFVFLGLFTT